MKKLFVYWPLLLACIVVKGQQQFTNFGNLKTFPGASVSFFGNFANDGTFTDAGVAVTFNGTSSQTISGTSPATVTNLVVNTIGSGIQMQQNLTVSNTISLTSGYFDLNSMTLTITNSDPAALSRTTGYILSEQTDNSSKVRWNIGTNTGNHIFPFGTSAGVYIPLTVTVTSGDIGNVTVSTYPTAANNTPFPVAPVAVTNVYSYGTEDNSANVVDRFWQIDKDGPTGTATLIFTATPAEVGTITSLLAQRWNSSNGNWDAPLPDQISTATTVTVPNVSTFSPWTMSGNNVPLPIQLLSFTAKAVVNEVDLNWETASEENNDYFSLERSIDGKQFVEITRVKGAGSSKHSHKYSYVDRYPLEGRSYYRLKQTDYDGTYKFSEIRSVNFDGTSVLELATYPNPVMNHEFSIDFYSQLESETQITLYRVTGEIIFTETIKPGISSFHVSLRPDLPTGVYVLKALNQELASHKRIVVE